MLEHPLSEDHVQKWVGGAVCELLTCYYADLMSNERVDGGGADTLHSAINRLLVVMALYPDVQRNGQAEIDRVIGRNRLPTIQE